MKRLILILHFCSVAGFVFGQSSRDCNNLSIPRAEAAVEKAAVRFRSDMTRPVFHFRPPAQWMNDINGPIYYRGRYHIFYQFNPYGDQWGTIHWGHAVSDDLVHWEHLPIALWPSNELGEEHCFSGSAAVNAEGQTLLFYTSVGHEKRQQWAALGDVNLICFEKYKDNPILDLKTHGGPEFGSQWRDPFIFKEDGRTFMILGADTKNEAVIAIYETADGSLLKWQYRGILYRTPKERIRFFECPNIYKVDNKWVLMYSPYGSVEYLTGSLDLKSFEFTQQAKGRVDYTREFYGTNILIDENNKPVLLGWVRGFKWAKGWNGCMSLPRELSLNKKGELIQKPIQQLEKLRGGHQHYDPNDLKENKLITDHVGDRFELKIQVTAVKDGHFELSLTGQEKSFQLAEKQKNAVKIAGKRVPLDFDSDSETLSLHLFYDRSVIEAFINDGQSCVTRVVLNEIEDAKIELSCDKRTELENLDIWNLKPIWND